MNRFDTRPPRRALLLGGFGIALAGCASGAERARPAAPSSSAVVSAREFAALEAGFGGRIGVYAVHTRNGATVGHRERERFLLCSTHKALTVGAILRLRARQSGLLDKVIHYEQSQLVDYSPITSQHVKDGMTVADLCAAALTHSDNTADNLLVGIVGGPAAVTTFARTLGDPITRLDRTEPGLNVGAPGDERDTSTPAQLAADLRALVLGDALDPQGRGLLAGWMSANTTGGKLIRAGVPASWKVADKTGSGEHAETNDIAVVWPPGQAPLIITVFTAPADQHSTAGPATVAAAARIAAKALVH